jgi:diguanylate cyclase (GGDEF)-like protein
MGVASIPLVLMAGDDASTDAYAAALAASGMQVSLAETATEVMDKLYTHPPHCLVLPLRMPGPQGVRLLDELKADNLYGHVPVIVVLSPAELASGVDWRRVVADDYLVTPFTPVELLSRIRLCLARAQRDLHANPLTGLPGNITIIQEAEQRMADGQPFSMAYLDIDHFKAFNDKYGFSRGDEVLRMTARILLNAVRALHDPYSYVGHVGGDDFIFLLSPEFVERACQDVLRNFELIVPNFYDEEDRIRGDIQSVDRQGNTQTFPLMTCSIAVVDTGSTPVLHIGEISARAAQVKKYAKTLQGSNFVVDRRS